MASRPGQNGLFYQSFYQADEKKADMFLNLCMKITRKNAGSTSTAVTHGEVFPFPERLYGAGVPRRSAGRLRLSSRASPAGFFPERGCVTYL